LETLFLNNEAELTDMRALLVKDTLSTTRFHVDALRAMGFVMEHANSGKFAFNLVCHGDYDIAIIDRVLTDMDGYELIRRLRSAQIHTPVMVISHASVSHERTLAFRVGADDVINVPVAREELVARVQTLLRRVRRSSNSDLNVGPIRMDTQGLGVFVNGMHVHVTGKEFAVLRLLLQHKGRPISKESFMSYLYDGIDDPDIKIIDVFICKLRKKFTAVGAFAVIGTAPGRGYMILEGDDSPSNLRSDKSNSALAGKLQGQPTHCYERE
jgi:two-component system cell cycle response regulator CtrA